MPCGSRLLALTVTLPLLATGCVSSSSRAASAPTSSGGTAVNAMRGSDGVQQITIDATNQFRFTPMTIHAHVGKLRIVLDDHGAYPHNISFPTLHTTSSTVSGDPGQQQTTITVTFTHAGNYEFVCTFHSSAGMKGQVTVT